MIILLALTCNGSFIKFFIITRKIIEFHKIKRMHLMACGNKYLLRQPILPPAELCSGVKRRRHLADTVACAFVRFDIFLQKRFSKIRNQYFHCGFQQKIKAYVDLHNNSQRLSEDNNIPTISTHYQTPIFFLKYTSTIIR